MRRALNGFMLLVLSSLIWLSACSQTSRMGLEEGAYEEGEPLLGPDGKADGFGAEVPAYGYLPENADLGAPLQVLFVPDEPVVTMELA